MSDYEAPKNRGECRKRWHSTHLTGTCSNDPLYDYRGCLCHACYLERGIRPDQHACQAAAEGRA